MSRSIDVEGRRGDTISLKVFLDDDGPVCNELGELGDSAC